MVTQVAKNITSQAFGNISQSALKMEIFAPQILHDGGLNKIGCGSAQPKAVNPGIMDPTKLNIDTKRDSG